MINTVNNIPDELSELEVHLFVIAIPDISMYLDELKTFLTEEERQKAARYHFAKDRDLYITAHAILRLLIARYIGQTTTEFGFAVNENGKPYLEGNNDIQFNISHSGEYVLLGMSRHNPLGVDVEIVKEFKNSNSIVERFFSEREKMHYNSLAAVDRDTIFFRYWVFKEAYIKALGVGMKYPLDQFTVEFKTDATAEIYDVNDQDLHNRWSFHQVNVSEQYMAAVVVTSRHPKINMLKIDTNCLKQLIVQQL